MQNTNKRYEVIYKMGARLEGPYSYIVLAQNGNAAIDKFKKEWKGFRTYVCEVREVA
jgi:hypothetical protein